MTEFTIPENLSSKTFCPRAIFWTNITLLGFNPSIHATGSYSVIKFDQNMFTQGPSSVKAMEIIIWFLFNELDSELAETKFYKCWPIIGLEDSREFRSLAYKWLEQLRRERCFVGGDNIVLRKSMFDECDDDRFYKLMMVFSNYVLKEKLKKEFPEFQAHLIDFESVKEQSLEFQKNTLMSHIKIQTDKFLSNTQKRVAIYDQWKSLADNITQQFKDIVNQNNELEKKYSELYKGSSSFEVFGIVSVEDLESIRKEYLQEVRSLWNICLDCIKKSDSYHECVDHIINDNTNKYKLDGNNINLKVPEIIIKKWENQFQLDSDEEFEKYDPTLQNVLDQQSLHWIFVGGKGGVGKTTTSCSLAVQLSKVRESVLLISTDPAHNLSDAFGQKFSKEATLVEGFTNLFAMEIDPTSSIQEMLDQSEQQGGGAMGAMMQDLAFVIPGVDEAMGFAEVMKQVKTMEYSAIIFDTAPTGHTLRFLSFPSVLEKALAKISELSGRFGPMFQQVKKIK
nr:15889_t:CDS:10 [Entrophospora candida]